MANEKIVRRLQSERASSTPPARRRRSQASARTRNAPDGGTAGEGPSGAGDAPDRRNHPHANSRCGGCSGTVAEGHRVVQLPCGHPVHARCVLSNLENGGGRLLLQCRAPGYGAEHPRRDTLAAAVQADPGLRRRAERLAGGLTDEPTAAPTLFHWSQDSPGIGPGRPHADVPHGEKNSAVASLGTRPMCCSWLSNNCQRAAALPRHQGLHPQPSDSPSSGTFCRVFYIPSTVG